MMHVTYQKATIQKWQTQPYACNQISVQNIFTVTYQKATLELAILKYEPSAQHSKSWFTWVVCQLLLWVTNEASLNC